MPKSASTSVPRNDVRAASYGIPGVYVPGNDPLAIWEAAGAAVARARAGEGPTLLEVETYRLVGHFMGDAEGYRPKDAIYNLMAKNIYFSGGNLKVPIVLMTSMGGGYSDGGQHSQCLYGSFAHLPGMEVVAPSNAYDAKGLMTAALRDNSPVVYIYHKGLQGMV